MGVYCYGCKSGIIALVKEVDTGPSRLLSGYRGRFSSSDKGDFSSGLQLDEP